MKSAPELPKVAQESSKEALKSSSSHLFQLVRSMPLAMEQLGTDKRTIATNSRHRHHGAVCRPVSRGYLLRYLVPASSMPIVG